MLPHLRDVALDCALEMLPLLEASQAKEPKLHVSLHASSNVLSADVVAYTKSWSHVGLTSEERCALVDRYGETVVTRVLSNLRKQFDKGMNKRAMLGAGRGGRARLTGSRLTPASDVTAVARCSTFCPLPNIVIYIELLAKACDHNHSEACTCTGPSREATF